MVGGGPFGLPAGAWTDDTSMALCLAESLIERKGFDPVDQLERYVRWYRHGYLSSTGRCFDIGNSTRQALERFERTGEPFPGDADPGGGGNGPLMKLAPVALALAPHPAAAVARAAESARTTHGAPQAADASRYFAGLLIGALRGETGQHPVPQGTAFEPVGGLWGVAPLHPEVAAVGAGSASQRPEICGGGYVIEALEAALWAMRSTRTFEDGVLAAVNLGDDADTTAAIFGQLAGAYYGLEAIPARWREQLVMGEYIVELADGLFDLANTIASDGSPTPKVPSKRGSVEEEIDSAVYPNHAAVPTYETETEEPLRPLPGDSYWVIEGQMLAGPYPGAPTNEAARQKLEAFLDAGVTCFVDLTEEGEGPPLHPYADAQRSRGRATQKGDSRPSAHPRCRRSDQVAHAVRARGDPRGHGGRRDGVRALLGRRGPHRHGCRLSAR